MTRPDYRAREWAVDAELWRLALNLWPDAITDSVRNFAARRLHELNAKWPQYLKLPEGLQK